MGSLVIELSQAYRSNGGDKLLNEVALILSTEWPQISFSNRIIRLQQYIEDPGLTVIYLLVDQNVLGHAELNPSYNYKSDDNISKSIILTSFIIRSTSRGTGIGSYFLSQLEIICQQNYSYLYLWAIGERNIKFYQKNNYLDCEPIASDVKVLQKIDEESISKLDNLFLKRMTIEETATKWLRKRILFQFQYKVMNARDRLLSEISTQNAIKVSDFIRNQTEFYYYPQSGPSCGLVAALMALHFILQSVSVTTAHSGNNTRANDVFLNISSTILPKAIESGFTADGEMFDIQNMHSLLCMYRDELMLPVDITVSSSDMIANNDKIIEIFDNQTEYFPLILLPYDRDQCGNVPGLFTGKKAHWAVIVGYICVDVTSHLELVGYQGMSDGPVIASSSLWLASNEQLYTAKDTSKGSANKWKIDPVNGPLLKQKCLLFNRKHKEK